MKKKKTILAICCVACVTAIGLVLLFILQSKRNDLMHYEVPVFDGSPVVSTGNGKMSLDEISTFLSQFTNENGTGQINLNMTVDEIAAVLDSKGVPYELKGEIDEDLDYPDCRYVFAADGTTYRPYEERIRCEQTNRGLARGDLLSKAESLYGEPNLKVADDLYDNVYDFYYNMGKILCKRTSSERTVILHIGVADETVISIVIRFLDEDEEIKLFK